MTQSLNGTLLHRATSYMHLGAHLTEKLSWTHPIERETAESSRTLGYITIILKSSPYPLRVLAYETYVWFKLEYPSVFENLRQSYLIYHSEAIQKCGTRFIPPSYSSKVNVSAVKHPLNHALLAACRTIPRLNLFHKFSHHHPCAHAICF